MVILITLVHGSLPFFHLRKTRIIDPSQNGKDKKYKFFKWSLRMMVMEVTPTHIA